MRPPSPPPVPEPLPAYQRGDFIGDLMQVVEVLGEGGFGIVYLARSLASNEIVALKTLRGELLRDQHTRALFEKEAKIWVELGAHPNLVRAKWVDEIGGRLYIAMEYVRAGAGRPNGLEGYLEKGPIPVDQALLWAIQFCHGMEYAVSKGIRCHRDIKPANILIGGDRVLKISDFGIAGLALVPEAPAGPLAARSDRSADDPAKTVVGTVFGTPTHMSPEQFKDAASCDERSDIYSFGVVLHQMAAAGRLPFRPLPPPPELQAKAGAYYWYMYQTLHTSAEPAPLTSPLAVIITRCLKKKREERYPSFAALRADLEALYEQTGQKAPVQAMAALNANDWNNKGISLATLSRWAEALECYDQSLALAPGSAAVHNNRGNALRNLGRLEEALLSFDQAIGADPLYPAPRENKALLYASAQRNEEALACVERAIALDPTKADPLVTRGVLLGRMNRLADEIAAYEAALRIDPRHVGAWFNKANSLGASDRSGALACVEQALACDPAYVSGWDLKGTLLAELGRVEEAVACHQEARRLAPHDAGLAYNLGNGLVALGRVEEARAAYEDATRLAPQMAIAWYNLGLSTLYLGDTARALGLFDRFLSFDPPHDGLRRGAERYREEIRAGRTPSLPPLGVGSRIAAEEKATVDPQALPELREVAPTPPPPAAPLFETVAPPPVAEEELPPPRPSLPQLNQQAAAHYNAGRLAETLEVVDRILAIDPRDAKALNTRANTFFRMNRREEACAEIVKALESAPGELSMWLNKAVIENEAGRFKEAYRSAIDLLEIDQARPSKAPVVEKARALTASLQSRGVVPAPRGHLGFLGLGYASMVQGRPEAALQFFDQAIAEAPDHVEVLRWKATALKELKRADDALALYDRVLALAPNDPESHHDRVVLAMLQDFGAAVEAFDRALALDPNHVASLSDKGKYAGELRQYEVALTALRRAAALMPDHPAPWVNKALVEDLLQRDEDALASFEKFLERAKPDMRLQIESAKRRIEQLRARIAARQGAKTLPLLTTPSPPQAVVASPAPAPLSADPAKALADFFSEDGDMSDDELARLAQAMSAQGAGSLMDMLRSMSQAAAAPAGGAPTPAAEAKESPPGQAAPPPAPRPTGNPVAKKWAEQGRAHLAAQKPIEALAAFDKAIERDPNEALYWGERGDVLKALSRHDEARASWTKALGLHRLCIPALRGLAASENAAGRHDQAVQLLMRAAGADPENAAAWFELGDSYAQLRDWKNAYAAFTLSRERAPQNAYAILGIAEAAMNLDRPDDALAALDAALAMDDTVATAWFFRGVLLSQKGRHVEAAESQRRAIEIDPSRANAWHNLAGDLLALKRWADALGAATRALQIRPDLASAHRLRGLALQGLRRHEEAVAAFDQSLVGDAASPQGWTYKGQSLLNLKRPEDALACFVRALELKPDSPPARDGKAAAEAALRAAAPVKIEDSGGGTGGELVLPEVTVPQTAPTVSTDECLKRSEMARNQAFFDRALEWADQAIAGDPRKYNGWMAKADALFGLKRFPEAAAHARKVTEMNPRFVLGWTRLATSFDALNALAPALAAWDKTVELAASNVLNWSGRGQCLARMGRLEEALACHEKALSIDPRFSIGKFYKGKVESDLGRREDAIRSLQQFLALAPPNLAAMAQEARQRLQELKA